MIIKRKKEIKKSMKGGTNMSTSYLKNERGVYILFKLKDRVEFKTYSTDGDYTHDDTLLESFIEDNPIVSQRVNDEFDLFNNVNTESNLGLPRPSEIVYVGITDNLYNRLYNHDREDKKDWDYAVILKNDWKEKTREETQLIEKALITYLNPEYNVLDNEERHIIEVDGVKYKRI